MKKREQNFDIYRGYLANALLHGVELCMESKSYKFHPGTMGWHYVTIGSNLNENFKIVVRNDSLRAKFRYL